MCIRQETSDKYGGTDETVSAAKVAKIAKSATTTASKTQSDSIVFKKEHLKMTLTEYRGQSHSTKRIDLDNDLDIEMIISKQQAKIHTLETLLCCQRKQVNTLKIDFFNTKTQVGGQLKLEDLIKETEKKNEFLMRTLQTQLTIQHKQANIQTSLPPISEIEKQNIDTDMNAYATEGQNGMEDDPIHKTHSRETKRNKTNADAERKKLKMHINKYKQVLHRYHKDKTLELDVSFLNPKRDKHKKHVQIMRLGRLSNYKMPIHSVYAKTCFQGTNKKRQIIRRQLVQIFRMEVLFLHQEKQIERMKLKILLKNIKKRRLRESVDKLVNDKMRDESIIRRLQRQLQFILRQNQEHIQPSVPPTPEIAKINKETTKGQISMVDDRLYISWERKKSNHHADEERYQCKNQIDEDCLDLHGYNKVKALELVDSFLKQKTKQKKKHVQIITGWGNHSKYKQPILLPAVQDYLNKKGHKFCIPDDNPGIIKVRLHIRLN